MTSRKPKPRPVVRVVIDIFPRESGQLTLRALRDMAADVRDYLGPDTADYRRPRVVSVRAVRQPKKQRYIYNADGRRAWPRVRSGTTQ